MKIVLDTNALVRFFTRDIETKAQLVKKLLDSDQTLIISDVVFPELEYVLMKQYSAKREDLSDYFRFLTSKDNIKSSKEAKLAVEIFASSILDMADCIIAAASFGGKLASFDRDLIKVKSVQPFWK